MTHGVELLALARCAGFISRAPGFSHPSVPVPARAGLALACALGMSPALHATQAPDGVLFVAAIAFECAFGAAMGVGAAVLYDGAYAGGRMLDDYVGIRGSVPSAQILPASGFGRLWSLVFTAGYFLLGGYRLTLLALARSFERVPAGSIVSADQIYQFALWIPVAITEAAILVAGPAIALTFLAQLALGAATRIIPRFASITLSFPIVFAVALVAAVLAVPSLFPLSGDPRMWLPAGPFHSVRR